jgi:hypothetical protein
MKKTRSRKSRDTVPLKVLSNGKRGRASVGSVDGLIYLYIFADFFSFYNFHVLLTDSCVNRKLTDGKYQYKNEDGSLYVHGFVLLKILLPA